MTTKPLCRVLLALASLSTCTTALAQFSQLITEFQTSGEGNAYPIQIASLGDLQVVMFQDPAEADVTAANIKPDSQAIWSTGDPNLPSTSESFVAAFANFGGANGSPQFLDIRFQWTTPSSPTRWALIETLQSPQLGDPSVHLGGKVRFYVNLPNCAQYEYPGLVTPPTEIGIALLIAETGNSLAMGFQDPDPLAGTTRYEFVGVSSVNQTDPNNPIPVPSRFVPVTDAFCEGATTGPAGHWRQVEFNLPTESVIGWTARGGNGTLNATDLGVNRGILAGLVIAVRQTDTTSDYVELLVDSITFEAPVIDPATAPTIGLPVIATQSSVKVNDVVPSATSVVVEVDRYDPNNPGAPFAADQTFTNSSPGLGSATELRFVNVAVAPALAVGDRLRAYQVIGSDVGPYSQIATVNPPAAFSATLSLDEDGNLGVAPADFEFVGAATTIGNAPQGHPVFAQNGVWQKLEFSLIPGVEPMTSFAGGDGTLTPTGGLYNIDAMFFSIDTTLPNAGPYSIFLDHVYVIDPNNNEVLIADSETANPFPNVRGQSTSTGTTSIISGLASYDGVNSNRLGWSFPDTSTSNTHAPFRPPTTFLDTCKAVGMWLLVEDPRLSALPLPAVEQRVIGQAPAVTISNIPVDATIVRLLVDGVPSGSVNPAGQASVNITPSVTLQLGDSISANYDTAARAASDLAYARVDQKPPVPTVQSPLVAGMTSVTVSSILNAGNAIASSVQLYANGSPLGAAVNPAGQSSVTIAVPTLTVGQQITARQTVNAAQSGDSAPVGVGTGEHIAVVINEFQYDDAGTDDREFIELYNAEADPVDISGWKIRCSDGTAPPNDLLADYTIPPSTILAAGDYYVMGHGAVPNVDQVLGTGNLFSDGRAATELLDQNGVVVDTLITERNAGTLGIGAGEGHIWGNFQSQNSTPQSLGRWFDGFDTNDNGRDFGIIPASPGATNTVASLAPYAENFDSYAVGADPANWIGSFVLPKVIDPTATSTYNLSVIPASPQGGKAMTSVDTSGGGNGGALRDAARFAYSFSCQVYINTGNPGFVSGNTTGEYETWSLGFGLIDQLHNAFHVTGAASGNTGLVWQFVTTEDTNTGNILATTFQLVNRNNGGNDGVVLLDVPSGSLTTGWHTLTLTRNYENVSASFDSLTYSGQIPNLGPAALGVAYREFVVGFPATLRPPTIDAVSITVPAAPTLGACCLDMGCMNLTSAVCAAYGGLYQGNGTVCGPTTCLEQNGACCFPDGSCTETTEAACTGAWQGAGTDCTPNNCPQPPTGACCIGAACSITTEAACAGAWLGDGSDCDPNPCVCLGDVDCDGDADFFDIDPFVAKLGCPASDPVGCSEGCPWQNADCDEDGDVDFFDIDPFVGTLGTICP